MNSNGIEIIDLVSDSDKSPTQGNVFEAQATQNYSPKADESPCHPFFVDLAPAPIHVDHSVNHSDEIRVLEQELLVPSHVAVMGGNALQIISHPLTILDADDFIDYLDAEDTKHSLRYYDEIPSDAAILENNRTLCKNCGAEGLHKTSSCPVQICLTCGVRDEHSTRSCPISKVCFTCGMKGHINANCPNRRVARSLVSIRNSDCERCLSSFHTKNECPTLWRLYEYFTEEEQTSMLNLRKSRKNLRLGQGGEGYVSNDQWCYNCGTPGHWGDDCSYSTDHWPKLSAFGVHNIMSGPFYVPGTEHKAYEREYDVDSSRTEWAENVPDNVGRRGKMKSRMALEKKAQEMEENSNDFFGKFSNNRTKNVSPRVFRDPSLVTSNRQRHYPVDVTGTGSLLDRIQHPPDIPTRADTREHRRDHKKRRSNGRHHDKLENVLQPGSGPRYKGGYAK